MANPVIFASSLYSRWLSLQFFESSGLSLDIDSYTVVSPVEVLPSHVVAFSRESEALEMLLRELGFNQVRHHIMISIFCIMLRLMLIIFCAAVAGR